MKLISYPDLTLYEINVKLYVGICRMCLPMFCRVPIHFFLHCRSFSACWPLFLIFSPPISVFPPTKFVSCFLSNALALLLTASHAARARALPKMFVVNQDVKNAKIDLCHAAAILSREI